MTETEQLVVREEGRFHEGKTVVMVDICEQKDGCLRIHVGVYGPDGPVDHWENAEPHFRSVEDARKDAIGITKKLASDLLGIKLREDQIRWESYQGPDAPRKRVPR